MQVAERCDFYPGDLFDDKYRIEKKLGEGSFGIVFKAKDNLNRHYAIKLLKLWATPPEVCKNLRDRFIMEFETGKIQCDYLVHSYSYGEVKGNPYIRMEFCPNGDLRTYLNSHEADYVSIGKQILYGLSALHSCGKVHRDLKPDNVLIRADGTAVLTDFGVSGDLNKRMTERNMVGRPAHGFGTFLYMPPEQVSPPRGQATVLPTTDIFSFGVMMYELMVGRLPFGELNDDKSLLRYLENGRRGIWDREPLNHVSNSGEWKNIIEGCLRPDFKQRIQSADSIINMLPKAKADKPMSFIDNPDIMKAPNGFMLRIMQGEEYGHVYYLNDILKGKSLITVGRNDIGIVNMIPIKETQSRYVSRHHCTLEKDSQTGGWFIRDGQWTSEGWKLSLNGTFVNSKEADRYGIQLKTGDIISIGDVKIRVEGY